MTIFPKYLNTFLNYINSLNYINTISIHRMRTLYKSLSPSSVNPSLVQGSIKWPCQACCGCHHHHSALVHPPEPFTKTRLHHAAETHRLRLGRSCCSTLGFLQPAQAPKKNNAPQEGSGAAHRIVKSRRPRSRFSWSSMGWKMTAATNVLLMFFFEGEGRSWSTLCIQNGVKNPDDKSHITWRWCGRSTTCAAGHHQA